jgi:hypothetical protein
MAMNAQNLPRLGGPLNFRAASGNNSVVAFLLVFAACCLVALSAEAQSLGAALNATNLTWTTSGTGGALGWSVETSITEDGVAAAQSGEVSSPFATSTLQTTVTGPGTLAFWWYVPVQDENETISFNVNGVNQASTGGPMQTWQQQTIYLGSGPQALQWICSQSISGIGGSGYLDEVIYTNGTTPPSITSQPLSQSQVRGLNNTFNIEVVGTPPLSYQWHFNSANISGATSSSYTVTNVQATNLGTYSVTVTNVAGVSNSAGASLEFGMSRHGGSHSTDKQPWPREQPTCCRWPPGRSTAWL